MVLFISEKFHHVLECNSVYYGCHTDLKGTPDKINPLIVTRYARVPTQMSLPPSGVLTVLVAESLILSHLFQHTHSLHGSHS